MRSKQSWKLKIYTYFAVITHKNHSMAWVALTGTEITSLDPHFCKIVLEMEFLLKFTPNKNKAWT